MRAWFLGGLSGLGLKMREEASRQGIETVIFGRSSEWEVDLADRSSVEALCKKIDNIDKQIIQSASFFVWNASIFECASLEKTTDLNRMIDVNIYSPTRVIQSLIKRKKELQSPIHLITISSRGSWKAWPDLGPYSATKAYQAQLSRCLAREWERDLPGSKVTIVMPAGVKTNIFRGTKIDTSKFMHPASVANLIWREALGQKKVCDWFNILSRRGEDIVCRENFAPELAYDPLPMYNASSSREEEGR